MHICMTFLNKGDKVLVPNPGYPTYSAAVRLAGGEMVTYALNKETNFRPDFAAIEKAGLDGVKMMLINYPNMPTGQTPTMEPVPADRGFRRQAQHTDRARQPLQASSATRRLRSRSWRPKARATWRWR